MRSLVLVIALGMTISACAYGQNVAVNKGIVTVNGSLYCFYNEYNNAGELISGGNTLQSGLTEMASFNDVKISAPDSEELIIIKARMLPCSSKDQPKYYYCYKLLPLNKEINIERQPNQVEDFLRDLVKYHVFVQGYWNDDGGLALYEEWRKKDGVIPYKAIAGSADRRTATTQEAVENGNEPAAITLKGNEIYCNGRLMATFRAANYNYKRRKIAMNSADRYYMIYNTQGMQLAALHTISAGGQALLWVGDDKQALSVVSEDKSEDKMMKVVAKMLMMKHLL